MKSYFNFAWPMILLAGMLILGCAKGDWDAPPSNLPEISKDLIISFDVLFEKLKAGQATSIGEEKYLEAVVVADDKSGNFYKTLILEDLKGDLGINISIDENELHAIYPVGQKVYVNLTNLAIGYYEGLPTLGTNEGASVGRIPAGLLKGVLLKAESGLTVTPHAVKIGDLNPKLYNTLVELEGMQFDALHRPRLMPMLHLCRSRRQPQFANCTGAKRLRNSGFADFAGQIVPSGNGKIVAVYSYRNAAQLFIRNVNDLAFTK
ncbi:MAG: DUF5689 domain-containing protein [Saprospiraceae bacterium]